MSGTRAWLAIALAVAVASVAVGLLRRYAAVLPQARNRGRGLHEGSVPRAGGLAIWAGVAAALPFTLPAMPGSWGVVLACAAAIATVSFADDLGDVRVVLRLAAQLLAAIVASWTIFGAGAPAAAATAALAIVWGSNLFNFMDGSDGLAAAMGISGFAALALAAAHAGVPWLGPATIAAALLPFFCVNRPPASMFMGDVGSVPLGFAAAASGIAGVAAGHWEAWFPLLVFLPFVVDATLTLAMRALRGERVWQAHRDHYYQRLHRMGAGHRGTLAIYAGAMLACAALALACVVFAPKLGTLALGVALALHLTAAAAIDYHWRRTRMRSR